MAYIIDITCKVNVKHIKINILIKSYSNYRSKTWSVCIYSNQMTETDRDQKMNSEDHINTKQKNGKIMSYIFDLLIIMQAKKDEVYFILLRLKH